MVLNTGMGHQWMDEGPKNTHRDPNSTNGPSDKPQELRKNKSNRRKPKGALGNCGFAFEPAASYATTSWVWRKTGTRRETKLFLWILVSLRSPKHLKVPTVAVLEIFAPFPPFICWKLDFYFASCFWFLNIKLYLSNCSFNIL